MKVFSLVVFFAWVVGAIGWAMNFSAVIGMLWVNGPITVTGILVLRIVGILLAPFGAVLGYF